MSYALGWLASSQRMLLRVQLFLLYHSLYISRFGYDLLTHRMGNKTFASEIGIFRINFVSSFNVSFFKIKFYFHLHTNIQQYCCRCCLRDVFVSTQSSSMSVCASVCLCLSVCLSLYLSVSLSVCPGSSCSNDSLSDTNGDRVHPHLCTRRWLQSGKTSLTTIVLKVLICELQRPPMDRPYEMYTTSLLLVKL